MKINKDKLNVAVVGASGMVGETMLKILAERKFPIDKLYLFSSARSAGKKVNFNNNTYAIEELKANSFDRDIDIALFSAGGGVSKEFAPIAAKNGCVVIDNSSAWRMDKEVPLVVPEVNPEDVAQHKGIIANPNCSTIQAVVALNPLHKAYGIRRIIYTTFQSVSGAGNKGIADLKRTLNDEAPQHFTYPIAGNCIPHIDSFSEDGYFFEEIKMINETRKILHAPDIKITATAVRVPVEVGHSESINLSFNKPFEVSDLRKLLEESPGVTVLDDIKNNIYPTPREAAGKDDVFVGRIRRDFSEENSVNLWVVSDNVRKGAATNAVQIAEILSL